MKVYNRSGLYDSQKMFHKPYIYKTEVMRVKHTENLQEMRRFTAYSVNYFQLLY